MDIQNLISSTLSYRDKDLYAALEALSDAGFCKFDLCMVPRFCPHFPLGISEGEDVDKLNKWLKERGLSFVSLNVVPGYLNSPDSEQTISFIKQIVLLASRLGAKIVTIPTGNRVAVEEWEKTVFSIKQTICDCIDWGEKNGVEISFEAPHFGTLTETVPEAIKFFKLIDDPRLKCTFDTSHVFRGETISLVKGFEQIGVERINHIHLRDVIGNDIAITPGKGHSDFIGFLKVLNREGYSGVLSLELEFDDLTDEEKQEELIFAKRYFECLFEGTALPIKMKIRALRFIQIFERFFRNPKKEIKRYPFLNNNIRKFLNYYIRIFPITLKTYEGSWIKRWRIIGRKMKIIRVKSHSIDTNVHPVQNIKIGILGCGYAGEMHGFGFRRLKNTDIVGVCDIDLERAKTLGKKLECTPYTSLTQMIKDKKPDLVSVCTREFQHYNQTIQLLEMGVDVFCEKILATRYNHAQEMVFKAATLDRVLSVNYNYRFIAGFKKLKEIIDRKCMGELVLINIKVHAFSYHHAIDLISYLGGTIQKVQAIFNNDDSLRIFGDTNWSDYDTDILYVPSRNIAVNFQLANGAVATIMSSYLWNHNGFILSADVLFEHGAVAISGINMFDTMGKFTYSTRLKIRSVDLNHKHSVFAKGYEYCFFRSIESFFNAYLSKVNSETTGRQGLFLIYLEKAIHQSTVLGRSVDIDFPKEGNFLK